jgi:hypothetical protein
MRQVVGGVLIVAGLLLPGVQPASAQDACQSLWVARNSIYRSAGYCFKTARAIRYFGNSGCSYDNEADLPLSRGQQARVQRIIAEERAYGCRY